VFLPSPPSFKAMCPRYEGKPIPLRSPAGRDLDGPAEPVQQHIHPGQRVLHPEPPPHLVGDPGQGPALIPIAARRRPGIQDFFQLSDLGRRQLAPGSARALRGQRRTAAGRQSAPPPVRRHPRHPEVLRDLTVARPGLDHLRRGQSYPLPASPLLRGQPAPIGVPHASGIPHQVPGDQTQ